MLAHPYAIAIIVIVVIIIACICAATGCFGAFLELICEIIASIV